MSYNLNNPVQFARFTMGSAIGILNLFAQKPLPWDIFEATYISNASQKAGKQPVLFLVFESQPDYNAAVSQIVDQQGRRKVKYQYPYRDGQTTDDLGRKPGSFQFNVLIFGDNYLFGLQNLIAEFNNPTPGVLTHPIFGDIQVVPTEWSLTHTHEQRKAVAMTVTFEEHNFSVAQLTDLTPVDKSVTGALSKLSSALNKIQNVINFIGANVSAVQSLKNQILGGISDFKNNYAQIAGGLNATFNSGGPTLPALLPTNQGGLQNSSGAIVTNSPSTVVSPSDPFAAVPINTISQAAQVALATKSLQKQIQGNRDSLTLIITQMESTPKGALLLHDQILDLKNTAIDLQSALETGIASSNAKVVQYKTPWDMSIREVAFANGLTPDQSFEVALLNPELESFNFIPTGTSVMVAVS